MSKSNVHLFRYSNRVAKVLEGFDGGSLNQKFENLVLYCFDEVPKREAKIKQLNEDIERMQKDIENLSKSPSLIQDKLEKM